MLNRSADMKTTQNIWKRSLTVVERMEKLVKELLYVSKATENRNPNIKPLTLLN